MIVALTKPQLTDVLYQFKNLQRMEEKCESSAFAGAALYGMRYVIDALELDSELGLTDEDMDRVRR